MSGFWWRVASQTRLEEQFAPSDYPRGLTARQMRYVWRAAAYSCAALAVGVRPGDKKKACRYAAEAWLKSLRRFPPETWSTGHLVVK